jgi:hypothetical protein
MVLAHHPASFFKPFLFWRQICLFEVTPEASTGFEFFKSDIRAGGSIPRLRERHLGSSTVMFGVLPRSLFFGVSASGANYRSPFRGAFKEIFLISLLFFFFLFSFS